MQLRVDGVGYAHPGSAPVLTDVSLVVERGESLAVVGPSGSGKTTLLALIGGLLRPQSGAIHLVDEPGTPPRPVADEASWVLQTVNVLPDRRVLDNVAVGAYADGASRAEAVERAREALDAVGLAEHASRPVRTLSGGENQRVVIARSLVSRRVVVLADEPTGQLDQATSATVVDALLRAAVDRMLIVVTHDLDVAARCSRTYRLASGHLSAP
ncbi:ABC transporter ATP-binding protein [Actinotalea subterranea]|uniref:ABC transporter ATP-binding protein n=1 Tax=Actinotalea subterranea TaxID=2607497 RepID=UPI00165DD660|nr:ATP-binding cassette domain-containing protein [Actinotalea subterranea]